MTLSVAGLIAGYLDLIAGALSLVIAIAAATIHVISCPRRRLWSPLPEYVRWGVAVVVLMFLWRGVNFLSIHGAAPETPGHINAEGLIALLGLAYLFVAGATAYCLTASRAFRERQFRHAARAMAPDLSVGELRALTRARRALARGAAMGGEELPR